MQLKLLFLILVLGSANVSSYPGNEKEELKFATTKLNLPSTSTEELMKLGNAIVNLGEYDRALEFYNKAITKENPQRLLEKSHALLYWTRGKCYMKKGDLQSALKDFKFVADCGAGSDVLEEDMLVILARKLIDENKIDEALWCISKAATQKPEAYNDLRGLCYLKKGDVKEAVLEFKKVTEYGKRSEIWNISSLMELANKLLDSAHFDEAIWCFSEMMNMVPFEGLYPLLRGKCYLRMENYDSAALDLSKAIELLDDPRDAIILLRKTLLFKAGKIGETTNDDLTASDPYIFEFACMLMDSKEHYNAALKLYNEIVKEDSPQSYRDRQAVCNAKCGKNLEATLVHFKEAVESGRKTDILDDAFYALASNLYYERKSYLREMENREVAEVYWCISEALKRVPNCWRCIWLRGRCHREMKDLDAAFSDMKEAIVLMGKVEARPTSSMLNILEDVVFESGKFDETIKGAKSGPQTITHVFDVYNLWCLGKSYLHTGKLDNALYCFNEGLKKNPNDGYTLCSRGKLFLKMGEFDAAVSDLKKGMPKTEYFIQEDWHTLIDALFSQGKFDEALKETKRLNEIQLRKLVKSFEYEKQLEKAIRLCDEGAERFPKSKLFYRLRGECRTKMAKIDFEKVRKLNEEEAPRRRPRHRSGSDSDEDWQRYNEEKVLNWSNWD